MIQFRLLQVFDRKKPKLVKMNQDIPEWEIFAEIWIIILSL